MGKGKKLNKQKNLHACSFQEAPLQNSDVTIKTDDKKQKKKQKKQRTAKTQETNQVEVRKTHKKTRST